MTRNVRRFFIIISLLSLLCVVFLPIHSHGGGILTDSAEYSFVRIIGDIFMEEGTLSLWVVQMTLCIFATSVVMLATAFTKLRFLYALADICALGLWIFNVVRYGAANGFGGIFDIYKTDIAVGAWAALLLLLINSLVLLCTKNPKKAVVTEDEEEEEQADLFCPHCGRALRGNTSFCPRCGKKIN